MDNEHKQKLAYKIIVRGKVQGVGFRYWTNALAKRLSIKGNVRNCIDSSVEILAEGTKPALEEFIYNLKRNHPMAKVGELVFHEIPVQNYKIFAIVR